MYAVVRSGGKQHRVEPGTKIRVEKLPGEVGSQVKIDQVLMVVDGDNVTLGAPLVSKASVKATVLAQDRGKKTMVFKKKRKKQYRRTVGHRQDFTELQVNEIAL
jgi:large subunit ribosomal protein L21